MNHDQESEVDPRLPDDATAVHLSEFDLTGSVVVDDLFVPWTTSFM